nr:DUF3558 domain-containing protein [Nocardia mikamii]
MGLAGCSSTITGVPAPASTTDFKAATALLWDPCKKISDDLVAGLGLDVSSKEHGIGGIDQSQWKICSWRGRDYSLTVYTTIHTVGEFERKEGNIDFADVAIAGRSGRQYRVAGASKDLRCDVVFPTRMGAVQLEVGSSLIPDNPPDPCPILVRDGETLVPVFPK